MVLTATVKNVAGPLRADRRMSICARSASICERERRSLLASASKLDVRPALSSLVNSRITPKNRDRSLPVRTLRPHVGSTDILQEPSFLSLTREGSILRGKPSDEQMACGTDLQLEV